MDILKSFEDLQGFIRDNNLFGYGEKRKDTTTPNTIISEAVIDSSDSSSVFMSPTQGRMSPDAGKLLNDFVSRHGDDESVIAKMSVNPTSSFRNETKNLLESLGHGYSTEDAVNSHNLIRAIQSKKNPIAFLEREYSQSRISEWRDSAAGVQMKREAGLISGLRGRSIHRQSPSGKGASFRPITGSFTRAEIIKQIQRETELLESGNELDEIIGVRYDNLNDLSVGQVEEIFGRASAGINAVGPRADQPGIAELESRALKYADPEGKRDRLYMEYITTLSPDQRMLVTSELAFHQKMIMLDTESVFGENMEKALIKSASDLSTKSSITDIRTLAMEVGSLQGAERVDFVEKILGNLEEGIVKEGYAAKIDISDFLRGGSAKDIYIKKADGALDDIGFELDPKDVKTSISKMASYLNWIKKATGEGFDPSGLNIAAHDITTMGYMAQVLGDYYTAKGSKEDIAKAKELYKWTGGMNAETGEIGTRSSLLWKIKHGQHGLTDITQLQRAMPIMDKNNQIYLGLMTKEELELEAAAESKDIGRRQVIQSRIDEVVNREASVSVNEIENLINSGDQSWGKSVMAAEVAEKLGYKNVKEFMQEYRNNTDVDARKSAVGNVIKDIRGSKYTESMFGTPGAQSVASADRMRIVLLRNLEAAGIDIKNWGLTDKLYQEMLGVAHKARADVHFSNFMLMNIFKRLREEGEVIQDIMDVSPEYQYDIENVNNIFKRTATVIRQGFLDFKGKIFESGITDEEISYLGRRHRRAFKEAKSVNVADVLEDENNKAEAFTQARSDDFVNWLTEKTGMSMDDALSAVEKAKKSQRYIAGAAIATVALGAVTNSFKEQNITYDSWDKSPKASPSEYYNRMQRSMYNNDMAQMGDLTIESGKRANYSYNMRSDKHDHLFWG